MSIMDVIMFEAQRQGRLSFYMVRAFPNCQYERNADISIKVSAGEEGIAVGSASALDPEDVIFAQYREAGVFQARGFTLDNFMNQLFSNKKDFGLGFFF